VQAWTAAARVITSRISLQVESRRFKMSDLLPSKETARSRTIRWLEILLAAGGALDCLAVVIVFSLQQGAGAGNSFDSLWPFPGLYFLEIGLIGLGALAFVAGNGQTGTSRWNSLPWIGAGILLTFVILGGFSIGPYLLPGMIFILLAGILGDYRQRGNWPSHFMLFLLAAMVQAFVLFLFIQFF
jgi:hypothetical protein